MLRTSLKGLLAHRRRLLGTVLAVVLGIGFLSGTFVLSDTVRQSFNGLFASIYRGTDVQVRGVERFNLDFNSTREQLDERIVTRLRAVPGVRDVSPFVQGFAVVVGRDGKAVGSSFGPPRVGASWGGTSPTNPFHLVEGHAPQGASEVVLDKGTARAGKLRVGDLVRVQTKTMATYRLVGVARFGSADSPLGATFAMFDLPTAQRLLGTPGKVDTISIVGDGRTSQTELAARVQQATAGFPAEAITGQKLLEQSRHDAEGIAAAFNRILLVFAAIALFVSCFVISNTFTVLVAQRTRELALLRAVGASEGQVLGSVVAEAAVVGAVASVIGIAVGVAVFYAIDALFSALGLNLPLGGPVIGVRTIVVALLVGVVVTTLSALLPALRAARVPPVAAMRDVAIDHTGRSRARLVVGVVLTVLALLALGHAVVSGATLGGVGVATAALLAGLLVLGPTLAPPLARLVGRPLTSVTGLPGALARENAVRNPGRTATTAAALMIGVALVTYVTVTAASTVASNDARIDRQFQGDFTVTAGATGGGGGAGLGGLPPEVARRIAAVPGVAAATPVRVGPAKVEGQTVALYGTDAASLARIVHVRITGGSLAALGADGIAVRRKVADDRGIALGAHLTVQQQTGPTRSLTVRAVYDADDLTGPSTAADYVVDLRAFDRGQIATYDRQILIALDPGRTTGEMRPALEQVLHPYALAELLDKKQYEHAQSSQIDSVLQLIYGLLALAVVIAVLGIANTLSLSAIERVRELGLLRAIGMPRRQLRRTMLLEAVIVACIGALTGLVTGLVAGSATVRALRDQGVDTLRIPVGSLVIVLVVAVGAALLAALLPARRAAKLDVIQAVTTE